MSVNIAGIDKIKLLEALWKNAKPASYFTFEGVSPPAFDSVMAGVSVKKYIDYYAGRCIKIDISEDSANPDLYDLEYGSGSFESVINKLRGSAI